VIPTRSAVFVDISNGDRQSKIHAYTMEGRLSHVTNVSRKYIISLRYFLREVYFCSRIMLYQ
jgi:hypothetical protein